ncbi:NTP transferase domain-containing protein [Spirillospora sp. CA-294931]|uniref:NTP transferase domain-containing protein n=1 Tax=Spirillospora sp. CA-294931 TaxID=3240042 RepID=UPI003D8D1469
MSRPPTARTVLFCRAPARNGPGPLTGLAGRSLIHHVLNAAGAAATRLTVVGADDEVTAHVRELPGAGDATFRQGGAGHALRAALAQDAEDGSVTVVVRSDTPLLARESVAHLTRSLSEGRYAAVRSGPAWAFDTAQLAGALRSADPAADGAEVEEVMTEVVKFLEAAGAPVASLATGPEESLAVTDQLSLAEAGRLMRDRVLRRWMSEGVTVADPATTWIDVDVVLTSGVTILRNTELSAGTTIGAGCTIGPDTTLVGTRVGARSRVRSSTCEFVRIGPENNVGPYSYLRGGTASGRGVIMGSHVHIKASTIGDESSVPHFAYLGDITIGARSNISGFSGTVNFDGVKTHETTVGDDVMIGAGTILVAPIDIGGGAFTAAGSLLTRDVPPGSLALTRIRQEHIDGWVESTMPESRAALTARALRDDTDPSRDG